MTNSDSADLGKSLELRFELQRVEAGLSRLADQRVGARESDSLHSSLHGPIVIRLVQLEGSNQFVPCFSISWL